MPAGVNFYQTFDYIRTFTPKPLVSIEAVCSALAKNAVDILPGEALHGHSQTCRKALLMNAISMNVWEHMRDSHG